ncbi:MAG: DUF4143 domain-containing protein, partial [Candidatus Melainabacteria bacterium]|nr:DUF4143 domain-containing protein [Candidatus Melainabacteria bacterium]
AEVENFVFKHLLENFNSNKIQFYRTSAGSEIDFIVDTDDGVDCIEVKYSGRINSRTKMPANISRFVEDHKQFRFNRKILITKEFLKIDEENKEYFIPAALFPLLKL